MSFTSVKVKFDGVLSISMKVDPDAPERTRLLASKMTYAGDNIVSLADLFGMSRQAANARWKKQNWTYDQAITLCRRYRLTPEEITTIFPEWSAKRGFLDEAHDPQR